VGRPAKFSSEQILDTTARLVSAGGPGAATMATIARELGGPTGSIYHRFPSRDLLMARLWVRTARRSQEGFLAALAQPDLQAAALAAAAHIPRWSREHLDESRILVLHRREDLAARWPDQLGHELAGLNLGVETALRGFARRRYGRATRTNLRTVAFALVDVPYAGVRRYLIACAAPPAQVDEMVQRSCRALLFP
jgi:AcrR family transcriptional regulator